MGQGLLDRLIGVLKLRVFTDDRHVDLAIGDVDAVIDILPDAQVRLRRGRDVERIEHRLIQPLAVIGERRLVDRAEVVSGHDRLFAHVAEQRDLLAFLVGDRLLRAADEDIRRDADGLQFLDAVLRRFGLEFTRRRQPGQEGQVHENALAAGFVMAELTDGLEEGQAFDVAHRAANFAEHEIDLILADRDEFLDFVGNMRNDLDRFAQVITAPFAFQNGGIDAARADRVGHARGNPCEAFVMPEVQIGLGAVIGHEHLAMFERAHRAGIDIQVRIELAQPDRETARLQQRAQSGGCQPFSKGRNDATSNENKACHRRGIPRVFLLL